MNVSKFQPFQKVYVLKVFERSSNSLDHINKVNLLLSCTSKFTGHVPVHGLVIVLGLCKHCAQHAQTRTCIYLSNHHMIVNLYQKGKKKHHMFIHVINDHSCIQLIHSLRNKFFLGQKKRKKEKRDTHLTGK